MDATQPASATSSELELRHPLSHEERQTQALENSRDYLRHIRNYVAIWFWLMVIGAIIVFFVVVAEANSSPYSY